MQRLFSWLAGTIFVGGLLCVSLAAVAENSDSLSLNLLNQRTLPSILSITAKKHNGEIQHGSGFFVDRNGQFVTSFKLIENAARITIRTQDGWLYKVDEVISLSPEHDLALLRAPIAASRPLDLSNPKAVIATGDTALAVGTQKGLTARAANGVVADSAETGPANTRMIRFTAPASGQSRGGPLVNQYGRVIGVVQSAAGTGDELDANRAVHVDHVRELMSQTAALPLSATWTAKPAPPPAPEPVLAIQPDEPEAADKDDAEADDAETLSAAAAVETTGLEPDADTAADESEEAAAPAAIPGKLKVAARPETSPVSLTSVAAQPSPPPAEMRKAHHIGQVRRVMWLPVLGQSEPGQICPPMISHFLERELGIITVTERVDADATLSMGGRIDTGKECNMWGCFDGYRLFMNFEISNYHGKPLFRDHFEVDEDDVNEACQELAEDIVDELEDLIDD